jgi:hypothetical protein
LQRIFGRLSAQRLPQPQDDDARVSTGTKRNVLAKFFIESDQNRFRHGLDQRSVGRGA